MALKIQQLNADTVFLLTFSPPPSPNSNDHTTQSFTVLTDPWLQGDSSILHPAFQLAHHSHEPAIQSLTELEKQPDLILISQDKPDHCHKDTLCSLPADTKIPILATPAAAKKIRSWRYFDAGNISAILPYDGGKTEDNVVRIPVGGDQEGGDQITIANMPAKRDMTGVHNVLGITYHSPSADRPFSMIYTPHGVSNETLEPYLKHHLEPNNAFPVTALLHCMNTEENPKILGGMVAHGAPKGVELAKRIQAKHWVGVHDEYKNLQGLATAWIKSTAYELEDVKAMLEESGCSGTQAHRLEIGGNLTINADGKVIEDQSTSRTQPAAVNGTSDTTAPPG